MRGLAWRGERVQAKQGLGAPQCELLPPNPISIFWETDVASSNTLALIVLVATSACATDHANTDRGGHARAATVEENASVQDIGIVSGVALGRDGTVYVSDFQGGVMAYTPDGSRMFTLSQIGSGPGDLKMPCCVDIDDRRQLWVSDVGNRRYAIFVLNGGTPTFRNVISSDGFGFVSTDRLRRAGTGVYHITTVQGGPRRGTVVVETVDSAGTVMAADTLPPPPSDPELLEVRREVNGGTSTARMSAPFGRSALLAFGNGFYVRAMSDQYRIDVISIGTELPSAVITRTVQAVTVSSREADSADALVDAWLDHVGGKRSDLSIPAITTKPVLQSIGVDQEGRIWVLRAVPDGAASLADLYERDGTFIDSRTWPSEIQLPSWAARGDTAIGVRQSPSGEVSLVRLLF